VKRYVTYLVDALILAALCLLFFWRHLTPLAIDRLAFVPGDFMDQFYAFARYEATRLQAGQLPLWNAYTFSGHPFIADIQSAVFYPLSLLTMALTAVGRFSYHALELEAIAHFVLAAVFTYLFARRLTGSRIGGLTAAVVFTFSGYLTSYPALQLAILETQVWLPLILLALDVAGERWQMGDARAGIRWVLAAGLLLGVAFLAGHPQSALLVTYAGLAYALFRFWPRDVRTSKRDWRPWLRIAGVLALFLAVGAGVAAVQLLPSVEFMLLSTRTSLGFNEAGGGFMPFDLMQIILPAVGGQFPALYMGLIPLGLAGFALVDARRDPNQPPGARRTIAFLGWALLVGLLLIFGRFMALYQVFYIFAPGWGLFRGQERTVVWVVLAVALLAGYGIAWLDRFWAASRAQSASVQPPQAAERSTALLAGPDSKLAAVYGAAALAALVLALAFFVGYQAGQKALWGFTGAALWLALFLGLTVVALRARQPALLLVFLMLDLFTMNASHHAAPADQVNLTPYRALAALPLADRDLFRTANDDVLPNNYGLLYNLEDIRGASPLGLKVYDEWLARVPLPRAWRLLNVKYVFSWLQELDAPAERLAEEPGRDNKLVYLYRLKETGPRAWLAGRAVAEPDRERTLERLAVPDFDVARQIVLPSIPQGFGDADACGGEIAWRSRLPERLDLTVTTQQPCILVLSEVVYPGWQATVDGVPAPILPADLIFRSVALTPGRHEVSFVFRPIALPVGAAISLITTLLAIAAIVILGRRGRR